MTPRRCVPIAALLVVTANVAAAQVITPPPRSTGGLFGGPRTADPNRVHQELSLSASLLGGYEDSVSPEGETVVFDPLASERAGMTGVVSTDIRYWRGKATRSFEVNANTFANTFRNLGVRPLVGGAATVNAYSRFKDSTSLSGMAQLQYQPTFSFVAGAAAPGIDAAPVDPTSGVAELRSLHSNVVGTLHHEWTTRQSTSVTGSYGRRQYTNGLVLDTLTQTGGLTHNWAFMRNVAVLANYQFSGQLTEAETGLTQPTDSHNGTLGLEIRKRFSPTRTLIVTGGAGAMHVRAFSAAGAEPTEYTAPSAFASWRMDLGRTWSVSANLDRTTTVLEGITRQSFLTSNGTVWLGGDIGRRVTLALAGMYSNGSPHEGDTGSYESASGTVQVDYMLGRTVSLVAHYAYYQHLLRDVASIPPGFPARAERNQIRIGMTVWLPLYGAFPAGRPAGGRN